MDKPHADALVLAYTQRLFGFALSKTGAIAQAEELAARATLEVYASLLRAPEVANPDGYVWRIAQHTYAKWVREQVQGRRTVALDDLNGAHSAGDAFEDALAQTEDYRVLRGEIARLSRTQRDILLLHYYDGLKLREIAGRLELAEGTVKWHLHDARNILKERLSDMTSNNQLGELGLRPIKFDNMGHCGSPGSKGDTADFLAKRLTQNIVYAAYWQPRTTLEIADELGVSPLFVEDEVAVLEEYGFLDQLEGGRYRTGVYITEPSAEVAEAEFQLLRRYAAELCDRYIPSLFDAMRAFDPARLYVPDGDLNLLMWSAVLYAMGYKLTTEDIDYGSLQTKRKDGGDYAAFAGVEKPLKLSFDSGLYGTCGDMTRGGDKYSLWSWQFNSRFDGRKGGWRESLGTDFDYLYEFMSGALSKEPAHIEKLRRLYDKQYLREDDAVNLIVIQGDTNGWDTSRDFLGALPEPDAGLTALGKQLDAERYALQKDRYPAHVQAICRAWSCNSWSWGQMRVHVLEQLLARGVLREPTAAQRPGVGTMLFCDRLPK